MEYITPSTPPRAQIETEVQYGKPVHQPIITNPGRTKMIADSVPAADERGASFGRASPTDKRPALASGGGASADLDDDIPF